MTAPGFPKPFLGLALVLGYVALDWVSFIHPLEPVGITPWNPPPGLALWALLVWGQGFLPVTFLAALAAEVAVRGVSPLSWPTLVAAAASTASYGVAALVLRRLVGLDLRLGRQRDVFWLMAVAGGAAFAAAVISVGAYVLAEQLAAAQFAAAATRYWIGDVIGVAVMTPLLLIHRQSRRLAPPGRVAVEAMLQGAAMTLALWLVFWQRGTEAYRYFYLIFLPMIWVAARFGMRGATLGNLAAQVGLIVVFQLGNRAAATVTSFQFLMLALAVSTLFLGAAVSERRRAQDSLRERQDELAQFSRLSLAGEVAAALAHELNQPLLATIAFTRAAQRLLAAGVEPARTAEAMDKAVAQAERAGEIVRALRQFIGRGEPSRQPEDVARMVADAVGLVRPRPDVSLLSAVDKTLPLVHVDRVQIQQVLVNLIRNGLEAVGRSGLPRRQVTVSARFVPEGMIEIEVADTGPGIAADVVAKLFQPFTTTKPAGMGLGLSISRTLVEANGGKLWLVAEGPRGCTFRFTLPVAETGEDS